MLNMAQEVSDAGTQTTRGQFFLFLITLIVIVLVKQ